MSSYDFLVNQSDLSATRLLAGTTPQLDEGQLLLKIDRFALTANNITYGVAGDLMGYWRFFPAEDGWGRIPVWGVATVTESRKDDIQSGSRYYGFFPMSGHLVVQPGNLSDGSFSDRLPHRATLPGIYNRYTLMTEATGFPAGYDNHQVTYRPLFTTSFMLDDFFADREFFGAARVILSSASSKTAIGTAFNLKGRGKRLVGLTSAGNLEFVKNLGLYDQVETYDNLPRIDASDKSVYIDMSGNRNVLETIHRHLAGNLVYSCAVGMTHHDEWNNNGMPDLPGAAPRLFFAPDQVQKRLSDWGPERFQQKLGKCWIQFLGQVDDWITLQEYPAPEEIAPVYQSVLAGAEPDRSSVLVQVE